MGDYEIQLIEIIKNDVYMMSVLKAVEQLQLNDAWVAAGLLRNKVWDVLHNSKTAANDIDVIYFDSMDISWETEKRLEEQLASIMPNEPWSVKNQARVHTKNGFEPYTSSFDGVAHFPETPTAIAARVHQNELEIMAPYGLGDLFNLNVKPTPFYEANSERHTVYIERMKQKKWDEIWKGLKIN